MVIGLLTVEFFIPGSGSLKSKRQIVLSIKDKVKNKFNVAVSEIDAQDKWQRCVLGLVTISTDVKLIHQIFDSIMQIFEENYEIEILNHNVQII